MDTTTMKLNSYLTRILKNKRKRWEEFFVWYRNAIETIDPTIAKAIGTFSNPALNKHDYKLELSVKDYAWWKETSKSETWLKIKTIDQIENDLRLRMIDVLDNADDSDFEGENTTMQDLLDYIDSKKESID